MEPEIKIFNSTVDIAIEFAETLLNLSKNSNGKSIHIALSGGSTPKVIFKILTEKYRDELANSLFHFWWGDDRCVPPSHDDSNYKWANDLWLKPIGIKKENIHRVLGENEPDAEAIRYSSEIEKHVSKENNIPCFDYILLGLGEDGHTASIFPHQMELLKANALCAVATHPNSGQKRISFTGEMINNAKHIAFLATGNKKAEMVREIILDKNKSLPATHIEATNGKLTWLLDSESAKLL